MTHSLIYLFKHTEYKEGSDQ